MKVTRDQMEHIATLAALGGKDSIKKLSRSERAVVKVVLETLKENGQEKEIGLTDTAFKNLEINMSKNLGSIPKERSNFIVRFCKGFANVFGRASSNKIASLIPAAIGQVHTHDPNEISSYSSILSYLSKERKFTRKDCESAWDKISMFDTAKTIETMDVLSDRMVSRIKTVTDKLKGTFKNEEISAKIDGAVDAMGKKLEQLLEESATTLADRQCDLEDIYDGLFQSLVEITISAFGTARDAGVAPSGQAGQPGRIKTSEDPTLLARDTIAKAQELGEKLKSAPLAEIRGSHATPALLTLRNQTDADIEITSIDFTYRKNYAPLESPPAPIVGRIKLGIMIKKGEEFELRQEFLIFQADKIDSFGPINGKQEGKDCEIQCEIPPQHKKTASYELTRDALKFV